MRDTSFIVQPANAAHLAGYYRLMRSKAGSRAPASAAIVLHSFRVVAPLRLTSPGRKAHGGASTWGHHTLGTHMLSKVPAFRSVGALSLGIRMLASRVMS